MEAPQPTVLAIGATGSIGRYVVQEALRQGYKVRALVRDPAMLARRALPPEVAVVPGDLTRPESLRPAVAGVDAIIFTHGSYGGKSAAQEVDYGGVRNVLAALGNRNVRIALMTTIGVTDRKGAHDWKRRGERLLRASGLPYTIVRPGWFDYNEPDQMRLVLLQGDRRQSGTPRDGVVSRRQVAKVLVRSLTSEQASGKTFELAAESGQEQYDLDRLFSTLAADEAGGLDAVHDAANMPLEDEPPPVLQDLNSARAI